MSKRKYTEHQEFTAFLGGIENDPSPSFGKFVEYDINGKEWKKEGIYYRENELLKEERFESFEENI